MKMSVSTYNIIEVTFCLHYVCFSICRDYVARMGLGVILNLTRQQEDAQLARSVSGILEHMFKHTEETSVHLITNGALDALLFWCRGTDPTVLRHCAVALANCAMYGGHHCQRWMIEKQAAEWLFPLAFSKEDELIRFHACLAVTVLAANREIEKEVVKSGTLELVEPFIASLDPDDFARSLLDSADSMQGRTASDLQHFLPLLDGTRVEGKCIAAFYLCVEASIKSRQRNTKVQSLPNSYQAQNYKQCCMVALLPLTSPLSSVSRYFKRLEQCRALKKLPCTPVMAQPVALLRGR